MKRLSMRSLCALVAAAMAVALLAGARPANAVDCNPSELSPCAAAIMSSVPPSKTCCLKLDEQTPCLCEYLKNPEFKPYIPGAKRVAAACGVTVPGC